MKPHAPVKPLAVLLVEDDDSDAFLLQSALESVSDNEFEVTRQHSLEEALPAAAQDFKVALLDLSLPGSSELEALESLRRAAPLLPIIILTGYNDEKLAMEALKCGAQDYLIKEEAAGSLIRRAIRYAMGRKHFEDNLTQLANYDTLTGLANRSLFESRLELALARARRSAEPVAVFFIDLDRFKQVNDRMGHEAGDELLKEAARRLKQTLRECDTVARFGGDEFAVLIEGGGEPRGSAIIAEKIMEALHAPFTLENGQASVGVSIGIAIGAPEARSEILMKHADIAMYRAKDISGSHYQFFTETMHQETLEKLQLEHDLAAAIHSKSQLCLYYQPKLATASGLLSGAEALIRWQHPARGTLSPPAFLGLLQPSLAAEMDSWVVETVCRDLRSWRDAGLPTPQISVHLSGQLMQHPGTLEALMAIVGHAGLHSEHLAIEIEESAALQDGHPFDVLSRLRAAGIEVHLDNFGAGAASLTLLSRCRFDALKIDRRLTGDMHKEQQGALVKSLVGLGHQFGMKVVAEGVETSEQRNMLSAMQCDQIQGYVISHPLPAEDFFQWMGGRQAMSA